MLASVTVLLALATSAFSYMVTSPSNSSGWTTSGPNVVTWTKVDTDRANFTIVLNNQQVTPQYTQILDAFVVGTDGSVTVNPPSGGWVAGSNYRVNLVQDSNDLSALLAQSGFFTIAQASSASSTFSSSSTGSSSAASSSGSVSATSTGSSVT
ncbi:hypothetical protein POSPLADRAFT_1147423 [Postia placenta MAD-698-R-SB12]|uniref:Yeast cell wall synthesis Kre9/Knh1-like N-terminal domain-containing protein n=1 Tax=Postia placenta MAD-698-R-SB12 TaxID=670580 RepID=A0A1X6MUP8_9APHY|nr:hypothetical protein POSPLADRAFT_1147423 [Postia placenta MAD-698-R-SB12]OSX60095.1 hypothetical protein POSPLADRAFT_1147423 [Postia placenta MAD-698-R-SB12]